MLTDDSLTHLKPSRSESALALNKSHSLVLHNDIEGDRSHLTISSLSKGWSKRCGKIVTRNRFRYC
jgi:hypothetical protein